MIKRGFNIFLDLINKAMLNFPARYINSKMSMIMANLKKSISLPNLNDLPNKMSNSTKYQNRPSRNNVKKFDAFYI